MTKYVTYRATLDPRGWLVLEEDGTDDGRLVADHLVEADARLIVALLNQHEQEDYGYQFKRLSKRALNKPTRF